jgi:PIN domain nuclease of toxin-antitoxin system
VGNYLLDTHTAIWFFNDDNSLSRTAEQIILDQTNTVNISIASVWELAIKISTGKLKFPGNSIDFMRVAEDNDILVMPVECSYITTVEKLPFIHRDPFDRMLIATAIVEKMTIITSDASIARYNVPHVW